MELGEIFKVRWTGTFKEKKKYLTLEKRPVIRNDFSKAGIPKFNEQISKMIPSKRVK